MRRENTIITKTFSYPIPDDYLHLTSVENKVGSYTYTGPDKLWVFVDNETGKLHSGICYTDKDDGEDVPSGPGLTKVCVTAENDPEILSMIWLGDNDYTALPTLAEQLPNGGVYSRVDPTPPDHTYELMDCVYNLENQTWVKPFPWKTPHMDWETLRNARTNLLAESDKIIATKILTQEQTAALEEYRQKLRELPTTFDGVDPWKVPFPELPDGVN